MVSHLKNRHLLIFYGDGSQKNIQTIKDANRIGIDLLPLLVHTNHRLQPLDVCVFWPVKIYFTSEREAWIKKTL